LYYNQNKTLFHTWAIARDFSLIFFGNEIFFSKSKQTMPSVPLLSQKESDPAELWG